MRNVHHALTYVIKDGRTDGRTDCWTYGRTHVTRNLQRLPCVHKTERLLFWLCAECVEGKTRLARQGEWLQGHAVHILDGTLLDKIDG